MRDDQFKLVALIAFVGGMFAGLWFRRRAGVTARILTAVVVLDVVAWFTYACIVTWQPGYGFPQIAGNFLYGGFGFMLLGLAGVSAMLGCFLTASSLWIWKRLTP